MHDGLLGKFPDDGISDYLSCGSKYFNLVGSYGLFGMVVWWCFIVNCVKLSTHIKLYFLMVYRN